MQVDPWTVAFQAINFLVLVWLLQRFLYRPVRRIIDERRAEAMRVLSDAADAKRRADDVATDYQQQMTTISEQRGQLIRDARAEIESERKATLARTLEEAEALRERERRNMDVEREALSQRTREQAANLAIDLAKRLLEDTASASLAETFLFRIEDHLKAMTEEQRNALFGTWTGTRTIDVATAPALDGAAQERCRKRLTTVLGAECTVRFSDASELIAGAALRFPGANLSISWAATLEATKKDLATLEAAG
jgi:F-type H+-transporting ATPase subunit b